MVKKQKYWSYEKSKTYVHTLELSGVVHWWAYARGKLESMPLLPNEIPKAPDIVYSKTGEWKGWRDFLGKEDMVVKWSYDKAKAYVRTLGLTSMYEWFDYYRANKHKDPNLKNIPLSARARYMKKGEWQSWLDFLGAAQRNPERFLSYDEAKKKVHKLGIKNTAEWFERVKGKDSDLYELLLTIPKDPKRIYGEEFKGWRDWFGKAYHNKKEKTWMSYKKASAFAFSTGVRNASEWFEYVRGKQSGRPPLPALVPRSPHHVYAEEWVDWAHFLQRRLTRRKK
ncbi:MAG: hypothetical protein ACKOXB_11320 [Flavobacteriales bacterium]